MLAFDRRRTTADAEHARKLPEGYHVVEAVLDGPSVDGMFLVKWMGGGEPKWELPQELRAVVKFQAYCEQHHLDKAGKPLPVTRGRRGLAAAATASSVPLGNAALGGGAVVAPRV